MMMTSFTFFFRCSTHKAERKLTCDLYGHKCAINADLRAHKRKVHMEGRFACDVCDFS